MLVIILVVFSKVFLERYVIKFKKNWRMFRDEKYLRIGKIIVLEFFLESVKYENNSNNNSLVKIR